MADKRNDGDQDVLSSLPTSRPARRSAKRGARGGSAAKAAGAKQARSPAAKRSKRSSPARERPSEPAAKRPSAHRRVPPAGYATPEEPRSSPGTGELLGSAVKAAGEVAQKGAGVGKRVVRGTLGRLTGR